MVVSDLASAVPLGEEVTIIKHKQSCHCLISSKSRESQSQFHSFPKILVMTFGTCHDHYVLPRK